MTGLLGRMAAYLAPRAVPPASRAALGLLLKAGHPAPAHSGPHPERKSRDDAEHYLILRRAQIERRDQRHLLRAPLNLK
jgi:hypothetical protein